MLYNNSPKIVLGFRILDEVELKKTLRIISKHWLVEMFSTSHTSYDI